MDVPLSSAGIQKVLSECLLYPSQLWDALKMLVCREGPAECLLTWGHFSIWSRSSSGWCRGSWALNASQALLGKLGQQWGTECEGVDSPQQKQPSSSKKLSSSGDRHLSLPSIWDVGIMLFTPNNFQDSMLSGKLHLSSSQVVSSLQNKLDSPAGKLFCYVQALLEW